MARGSRAKKKAKSSSRYLFFYGENGKKVKEKRFL